MERSKCRRIIARAPVLHLVVATGADLFVFAARTSAHALLLSGGQVQVHSDRIVVDIEIAGEDFLHFYRLPTDNRGNYVVESLDSAVRRHGQWLANTLDMRDVHGRPILGKLAPVRLEFPNKSALTLSELRQIRVNYQLIFPTADPPTLLTFRLRPHPELAFFLWQLGLRVQAADHDELGWIRLTSRGNVETIELSWMQQKPTIGDEGLGMMLRPCQPFESRGARRFKELFGEIDVLEDIVELRLFVPIPLLETWLPLERTDEDFLSFAEQEEFINASQRLCESAMSVEGDGVEVQGKVSTLAFHSGVSEAAILQPRASLSSWTGHLSACVRYRTEAIPTRLRFRWNLFNGRVLSSRVNIQGLDSCENHEFSTYEPWHTWTLRKETAASATGIGQSAP